MGVTTTLINKPFNPRAQDQSPLAYNRAKLYSGKALDFDGVNDSVSVSSITDTYKSFCFYFKPDADINDASSLQRLFGIYEQYFGISTGAATGSVTGETLVFMPNSGGRFGTRMEFTANTWYHVAVVAKESDNTYLMYINAQDKTDFSVNTHIPTAATDLKLAMANNGGPYFNGQIANFKAFNVALTAAQVADLYNNPEKVVPTGVDNTALKLWLPMMEGAGTTAYDGSGNGNHGTISGATYVNGIGAPSPQSAVMDWNKGSNSFTYSEDFSNADWLAIDVTKVSTSETDYIGGNTAANITWLAGSPRYFYQNIGVSGASTLSFYVKSNGGGNKFRLFGNGTLAMGSDMTATSEWVRYDFEFTGNASQGIGITQASDNSAADLLVCFAQVETNASVGPYIPTLSTAQTTPILLPQGLTSGRDITGVNLFENVRKQGALNLDGNSWAEVHDNASLDITSAITLEAWVQNSEENNKGILGRWFAGTACYMLYKPATDNNFNFYINTNYVSSGTVTARDWHHVVGVYDGTTKKIYVNGVLANSLSETATINTSSDPIEIGRFYGGPDTRTLANQLAQPRIYNRALTAEEVQRSYDSGKNIYTNS